VQGAVAHQQHAPGQRRAHLRGLGAGAQLVDVADDVVADQVHGGAAGQVPGAELGAPGRAHLAVLEQGDLGQFGADVDDQQGARGRAGAEGGGADGVDEQQPGGCEDRVEHAAGRVLVGAGGQQWAARHEHTAGGHRLGVPLDELRQQARATVGVDDAAPAHQGAGGRGRITAGAADRAAVCRPHADGAAAEVHRERGPPGGGGLLSGRCGRDS
jgi:hypothetical protein